jgi:hypothetical protein
VTSRVSPDGIDPVADVDAGERRAQRLRDLPDGDAERPGERRGRSRRRAPASAPSSTARRRRRPAPAHLRHPVGQPRSSPVGPLQLQLDLLLFRRTRSLIDAVTPPSAPSSIAQLRATSVLVPVALVPSGVSFT